MYLELRERAEKRVQARKAFYTCIVVFSFATAILLIVSYFLPVIGFWLKLPIPFFIMILGILYFSAFGFPASKALSEEWQEDEIEKEMIKLYKQKKAQLPPPEELSETEVLDLKELELLKEKWDFRKNID